MIRKAKIKDLENIVKLYEDTTEHLGKNINYPNWKKHEYPNEDTAKKALIEDCLYVYEINNEILGSAILNHDQPTPYNQANWQLNLTESEVLTIHTLLVHPNHFGKGIAKEFILFAENLSQGLGFKSIRLDTFEENIPAQKLYEGHGYVFCGKINLKPDRTTKLYFTYEKLI